MVRLRVLPWEYGVRNLLRRPARSLLTLGALSTVVFLVLVIVGFIRGLEKSLAQSGDPAVVLVSAVGSQDSLETSSIAGRTPALLAATAGCGTGANPASQAGTGQAPAAASPYRLTAEPAGAHGVIETRRAAKDDDAVTLVGRVGGEEKPFVEGAAPFDIVDLTVQPCEDGCPTPWDYCCAASLESSKAMVKVVDAGGSPVSEDARQLLSIKELSTVVVHGRAKRDGRGNLTVLADGVYVKP